MLSGHVAGRVQQEHVAARQRQQRAGQEQGTEQGFESVHQPDAGTRQGRDSRGDARTLGRADCDDDWTFCPMAGAGRWWEASAVPGIRGDGCWAGDGRLSRLRMLPAVIPAILGPARLPRPSFPRKRESRAFRARTPEVTGFPLSRE
ncbi:hypothetical protein [Lysobacter gummosus]|uniref:hypothetical protein n=1 Tax=Lysobacter gummosus TaxID=262324 RepID=UPI0036383A23